MPSSADPLLASALARAAEDVEKAVAAVGGRAPRIVIDGRSGAGKTALAADLVARSGGSIQSVALDDLYPGWDGLAAGVDEALRRVIVPHAAGVHGVWRRWDWGRSAWAEEHTVDPSRPLLVEGAGILTPAARRAVDVGVWLDAPEASRRHRALTRDGDRYRPFWERWAAQEERHILDHDPRSLATHVALLP